MNYSDFAGVFDGKGHTIRNMNFTCVQNGYGGNDNLTYDYQGLFGVIVNGATVRNFTVYGEIILAADEQKYIGGAVGLAYSGAKIENVTSYVDITDNKGEGEQGFTGISQIGGVVGQLGNTRDSSSATAQNCRYYGKIDVNTAASVGGIAGQGTKNSVVQNCVNYGTVGWNYIGHAGGIVGSAQHGTQVKNCINRGKVSVIRNDCVGGVVGYANDNVYIENCANYADIEARKSDIPDEPNVYLGGILGYVNSGKFGGLTGCFNYGKVTDLDDAYTYTGAIGGYIKNAPSDVIKNNAYLDTSCSKAYDTVGSSAQPEAPATAAPLPSDSTTWTSGWYYVQGDVTFDSRVTISGDVKLILLDGATVTVNGGIGVNEGNTFTVYAQSDETAANLGKLIAQNVEEKNTGIGETNNDNGGTITINGGTISATSGGDSYDNGIGSPNCNITVNGGNITANSYRNDGIHAYTFTVNGGNITANGDCYGINNVGTFTVNGGNITANGDWYGIWPLDGTINDGTIIASGSRSVFRGQPTLNGYYRFFFGSSLSDLTAVPYVSAIASLTTVKAAKLEPCMVHDFAVTCINETTHATQCKWCGYRKQTHDHDFGGSNTCACGYGHVTYREYDPETEQFETKTVLALPISSVGLDWASGWYCVQGDVTIDKRVTVSGDVKLILLDGATLTVNGGICVNEGNTFTVYAQSDETAANLGKLIASATGNYMAGIGGNEAALAGTITIHGGIVNAEGGDCASGIGGGWRGGFDTITINGGVVSAEGGYGGAGIGTGWTDTDLSDGTIIINGGVITARGGICRNVENQGNYATGIGTGDRYGKRVNVTITINGGTITAIGTGKVDGNNDKYGAFSCAPVFGDNYRLCAGSSEDALADVPYTSRDSMITSATAVKLTPCTEQTHDVSIYAYVDGGAHTENCKWCGSASNKAHATNENGLCICGASAHIYLSYNTETACYDAKTVYALPLPSGSAWTSDWYYVQGDVTLDSRVTVSGDVKLILCNGATLTVNGGIQIDNGKTLTVYAQSLGATVGKLTVQNAASGKVGISGTLTVCGGQIMAYGSSSANAFGGTIDFRTNNHTVYGGTSRATLAPIAASSDACGQHKVLLIVCGTMSGEISADVVWTSMEFTYTDSTWDPATHSYTGGWTTTGGTVTVTNRGTSELTAQLAFTGAIDGISGTLSKANMTIAAGASDTVKLSLTGKPGTALDRAALGNITVTLRAPRSGWYYDDASGSAYFYRDGSPLTGWQTIDGTKYHFAESGTLSGDICDIGGNRYFFGIYGNMLTGWQTDASGNKYYADTSDGHALAGWQDIDEKTYYFYPADSDTPYVMATGKVEIDGNSYNFTIFGYLSDGVNGFVTGEDGKTYFYIDGEPKKGWLYLDANGAYDNISAATEKYYFDPETGVMQTGWQTLTAEDNKTYTYYFDPATGAAVVGRHTIDGKEYAFTAFGNRVVDGKYGSVLGQNNKSTWLSCVLPDGSKRYYYFSGREVQDLSSNPYLTIDDDLSVRQGLAVYPNGVAYYLKNDKMDQQRNGWIVEEEGIYYIDTENVLPKVVKSGTKTIDGVQYTFDEYYRCTNPPADVLLEYKDNFGKDYTP